MATFSLSTVVTKSRENSARPEGQPRIAPEFLSRTARSAIQSGSYTEADLLEALELGLIVESDLPTAAPKANRKASTPKPTNGKANSTPKAAKASKPKGQTKAQQRAASFGNPSTGFHAFHDPALSAKYSVPIISVWADGLEVCCLSARKLLPIVNGGQPALTAIRSALVASGALER